MSKFRLPYDLPLITIIMVNLIISLLKCIPHSIFPCNSIMNMGYFHCTALSYTMSILLYNMYCPERCHAPCTNDRLATVNEEKGRHNFHPVLAKQFKICLIIIGQWMHGNNIPPITTTTPDLYSSFYFARLIDLWTITTLFINN